MLALSVLCAMSALPAMADCDYDGYSYPTGTVIRGLTCQPNGTWR
jgi:hypothetical protein